MINYRLFFLDRGESMPNSIDMFRSIERKISFIRWVIIFMAPLMIPLSDYRENLVIYVVTVMVVGGLYNSLVTFACYNNSNKLVNIVKYTSFFDLLLITLVVYLRGGLRSDTFMLYLLVILGSGAKHGIKGTVSALIQTIIYYSVACYIAELPNVLDWERLIIRIMHFIFTSIMMHELSKQVNESTIKAYRAQLEARLDPLTRLPNRLMLTEYFESLRKKYKDTQVSFAIVMIDIDNFKQINDTFGHPVGDKVLETMAKILKKHLNSKDFVCRFGGEEFLLLLDECDKNNVLERIDPLKKEIDTHPFDGIEVTVSIGISIYNDRLTMIENITCADQALYAIKNMGKNRVLLYDDIKESDYGQN